MRAYAVNCFCEPLERVDRPDARPVGTEVVVEVTRCGVCHTDLHIQDGYYDAGGGNKILLADRGVTPPVVMGHEVLGRLVARGPEAPIADADIGKTFLVYPWLGCGVCEVCRRGDENLCARPQSLGVFRAGGYAEQCVVPHPKYLVDATGLAPALASTFACSGVTAYSALRKVQIDKEKDLLLIMGLGGVGLSALNIARGLGYQRVAVADIDAGKRELASRHGAALTVDPRHADAGARSLAQAGGAAAAIDFVGASATTRFAVDVLQKGGTCIVVGLFGGDITLPLPTLVLRAISLRGSYVGNLAELKELVSLFRAGSIEPLPVEEVGFDDVNEALMRLRAGKVHGRLVLAR
ncbi:alcohol dehydrogenase [Cupriavidus sp. MP-37]|uniref:alcohol dehydrogenase n=1 Tax=Cupriavidus sp. MP-37 TaxID=2884455 RepID=UPI001D0A3547|nr:alcohol dehydrogenase [Cupriavidus sp. MP-37]UDM49611.1 alcohol dehydrogenase [Cupriavidus sp. MP-37]